MPWKESGSDEGSLPDLQELISIAKEKIKNSFKAKNHDEKDTEDELIRLSSCLCENNDGKYIVEIKVKCDICENVIKEKTITNPYKAAAILVIVSYGASQFLDYSVTDNRYPIDTEYGILEACISSYKAPLSYRAFGAKKKICLCALEDTMNEISYIRYKVNEKSFLKAFVGNAKTCK